MLLNYAAGKLGVQYDDGGRLARSGKLDNQILHRINALEYYHTPPPKTLGYEWVEDNILTQIEEVKVDYQSLLTTFTEHISQQLASAVNSLANQNDAILITGGGAFNSYLIERLTSLVDDNISITLPDDVIISFKEAIIFAFLGVLRFRNEINCLASVTGASKDSSTGILHRTIS